MNTLNVIGAIALASSIALWVFDGAGPESSEAANPLAATPAATATAPSGQGVSAIDAEFIAAAFESREPLPAATAAPAAGAAPQSASLALWPAGPAVSAAANPLLTVAFTTPDPVTLIALVGAAAGVALRRTRAV